MQILGCSLEHGLFFEHQGPAFCYASKLAWSSSWDSRDLVLTLTLPLASCITMDKLLLSNDLMICLLSKDFFSLS